MVIFSKPKRSPGEILAANLANPDVKAVYEEDLDGIHNIKLATPTEGQHVHMQRLWGEYVDSKPNENLDRIITPDPTFPTAGASL